jgi:hypothetical protein
MTFKPKERIKRVFEKTTENGGNVTKAMREMKYSENTINHPSNVTETKSWEMLRDEYIPESLILKTHKEAFEANRTISVVSGKQASGGTTDFVDVPDWQTRMKATELGYKVHKKLDAQPPTNNISLTNLIQIVESNGK